MPPATANVTAAPWRRLAFWLGAAIVVHVALGIARVPHAVIGKRWTEIEEIERDGFVAWSLSTARLGGADAIDELLRTTAADAIVPVRGPFKGALEYAPRLLWPRLCCAEHLLPAGLDTRHGRPIAPVVLVGDRGSLHVEAR
jgi:hypothetical protein